MDASLKLWLAFQILIASLEVIPSGSVTTAFGGDMRVGSVGGAGPTSGLNSLFNDPAEPDNSLSSPTAGSSGGDLIRDMRLDMDQPSHLGQSGSEDGMAFLRGSEKDFMQSAKGVNIGFPSRADMKAGQPDMRYAMDLSSPSPSSSSPVLDSRVRAKSIAPKPAKRKKTLPEESKFGKMVESQRDWWSHLRGASI